MMKTIRMRAKALLGLGGIGICTLFLLRSSADAPRPPAPPVRAYHNQPDADPPHREALDDDVDAPPRQGPPAPPALPKLPVGNAAYPDFGEVKAAGRGGRFSVDDEPGARRGDGPPEEMLVKGEAVAAAGSGRRKYPNLIKGKFIPPNKIVHFDLKGGAPKVDYFREVFKLISKLGATGVLLEWEDMFPFFGPLAALKQNQAYSPAEIRQILSWAQEAKLDIIPLVQTFGHLEYILKYPQFAKYRQVDRYPQVICLGDDEAVKLVNSVVDQVMSIHKDFPMPYFHIGADEAFQIGMCQKDQELMRDKLDNSRERLMLRHIANTAQYVKRKYKTKVLMWHDMLNNVDNQMIQEYKLGELVEPVVWAYAENLNEYLFPDMWQRFGELFPFIWGGSAFKGADGPSRYYSNIPHYLQNHVSWLTQMTREHQNFKEMRGLILTGWSRFDHFAVLCEVLPVGVPSLAVNLLTVSNGVYDRNVLKLASTELGCSSTLDIDTTGVGAYCNFPGSKVYQLVQQLRINLDNVKSNFWDDYQVQGWLSRFNVQHNYSQPWYLDQINDKLQMYLGDLRGLASSLRNELSTVLFPDAVDEWLYEYVEPELNRLKDLDAGLQRMAAMKSFPARPFSIRLRPSSRRKGHKTRRGDANEVL